MSTFSVKAETKIGKIVTIRSGFVSEEAAEDHPIRLADYARVWIEEVDPKPPAPIPAPPPAEAPRQTKPLVEHDAEAFALIEQAAIDGARCPQTDPHGPLYAGSVSRLVAAGKIKSEVFAHNFRRVTILVGPHAGAVTASPPGNRGAPPFRVNGRLVKRGALR